MKLQLELWPPELVAVHVTEVVPSGKVEPEGGLQTTEIGVQLPEATAVKVTAAPHWPLSLHAVMLGGQVIVGGVQVTQFMACGLLQLAPKVAARRWDC